MNKDLLSKIKEQQHANLSDLFGEDNTLVAPFPPEQDAVPTPIPRVPNYFTTSSPRTTVEYLCAMRFLERVTHAGGEELFTHWEALSAYRKDSHVNGWDDFPTIKIQSGIEAIAARCVEQGIVELERKLALPGTTKPLIQRKIDAYRAALDDYNTI